MTIDDGSLYPAATGFQILIRVLGLEPPGLAAFDFSITYDSEVINITGAETVTSMTLTTNAKPGELLVSGFTGSPLVGDFILLDLIVDAAGSLGDSTASTLSIREFGDPESNAIAVEAVVIGRVTINPVLVAISGPAEVAEGIEFLATLEITALEDLNAASYHVVFDPNVLELINVSDGDVGGVIVPVDLWNLVSPGIVSIFQKLPGLGAASGSGYLAELRFQPVGDAAGSTSEIGFDHKILARVLSNKFAEEIPAEWMGTTVQVIGP